ncbi:ankyrin-1-like isoform X1 [Salvia divinorum]|uniref:Ankyrin-1-like isoform X1 n=1 Tax=Salvia divinorum TaxID=28513 RepID=A0ABD1FZR3_SALDI
MGSTSEIGASIIEAGASGDLNQLRAIRKKVGDDWEFRRICDQYTAFSTGWSVLHHAVEIGHFEMCRFLIKKVHVFVDPLTYKMDAPIAQAAKRGHVEIVKFLIEHGANVGLANIEGFTPLHYALLIGNMELMELLLRNRVFVDAQSVVGTPLQIALSRGNAEAVKSLLSHGANPNYFYSVEETPLGIAVNARSFECLKLLLEAKADPNAYFNGLSPLSAAAREPDTKFLKSLLAAKADPNLLREVTDDDLQDIFLPIEEAATVRNRAAMEILFPVTKRLAHYPNWTIDGIIEYVQTEEFLAKGAERVLRLLTKLDIRGMQYACNEDLYSAIVQYRAATILRPWNTKWLSKLSMWEARLDLKIPSLLGAQKCVRLMPDLPVPVQGEIDAAANVTFKKFLIAGLAFSLDPYNKDTDHSFRVCLFDYFVWLTQMRF